MEIKIYNFKCFETEVMILLRFSWSYFVGVAFFVCDAIHVDFFNTFSVQMGGIALLDSFALKKSLGFIFMVYLE